MKELEKIYYLDAGDIPNDVCDDCLELDDEFPLHYSSGIIYLQNNDEHYTENGFYKWLVSTYNIEFDDSGYVRICVQGT